MPYEVIDVEGPGGLRGHAEWREDGQYYDSVFARWTKVPGEDSWQERRVPVLAQDLERLAAALLELSVRIESLPLVGTIQRSLPKPIVLKVANGLAIKAKQNAGPDKRYWAITVYRRLTRQREEFLGLVLLFADHLEPAARVLLELKRRIRELETWNEGAGIRLEKEAEDPEPLPKRDSREPEAGAEVVEPRHTSAREPVESLLDYAVQAVLAPTYFALKAVDSLGSVIIDGGCWVLDSAGRLLACGPRHGLSHRHDDPMLDLFLARAQRMRRRESIGPLWIVPAMFMAALCLQVYLGR